MIFFNEKNVKKDLDNFRHRKLNLKVRILQFLTTFTQLTARHKNCLRGWLLVLGLKKGLVECEAVCVKSEVILTFSSQQPKWQNVKCHNLPFIYFIGEAGEGLVELRRIETAEEIAHDMAASRNVVYLPQGQSTLLALPQ